MVHLYNMTRRLPKVKSKLNRKHRTGLFFHPSVIGVIDGSCCEIAEHPFHIDDTADGEPEGTDDRDDRRDDEVDDQKVNGPVFVVPRAENVPDDHCDKGDYKVVDKCVNENRPCDDFIPSGVVFVDPQKADEKIGSLFGNFFFITMLYMSKKYQL